MIATRFVIAAAAVLCATAATAQTHSELLEKAIFAEETQGDLAGAISIYERLVSTPGVPREIAARAQVHLAAGRRQREQAESAASVAAQQSTLPRTVNETPTQADLAGAFEVDLANLAKAFSQAQVAGRCCGWFSDNYDPGKPVTVIGPVVRVEWMNPLMVVYVDGSDGNVWGFTVAPPNAMIRFGWNRTTLKVGDPVFVSGFLAKGQGACPGPQPNACAVLPNGALHASASTIARDGKTIFDRHATEQPAKQEQEQRDREKAAAAGR